MSTAGKTNTKKNPVPFEQEVDMLSAGEILLNGIALEGTRNGFYVELIEKVSDAVVIPVIVHGGAGRVAHIGQAVK